MTKALDLKLIDEVHGKSADLYEDVLKVSPKASNDEIQVAYFDRRSELFTTLSKLDAASRGKSSRSSVKKRSATERKMDSVVFAVRILGDPKLRKSYDKIRNKRMHSSSGPIVEYTLQPSASAASSTAKSRRSVSSSSSKSNKYSPQVDGFHEDAPELVTSSSSMSEGKHWIQSSFSSGLFTSMSGSKTDENEDRRKQKKSKAKDEKGKKSLWNRSKKQKNHPRSLNESMDTHATDTSMTDYEDSRNERKSGSRQRSNSIRSDASSTLYDDDTRTLDTRTYDDDTRTLDTRTYDDDTRTYDADTLMSGSDFSKEDGKGSWFECMSGSKALKKLSDEISGACEDTLVSVDQVFNAFTLTDKDIHAVTKKIHKAKRQLDS